MYAEDENMKMGLLVIGAFQYADMLVSDCKIKADSLEYGLVVTLVMMDSLKGYAIYCGYNDQFENMLDSLSPKSLQKINDIRELIDSY